MQSHPRIRGRIQESRSRSCDGLTLLQWIVVSMVVGILVGWLFPEAQRGVHGGWAATDLNVLSSVFLRMIKSLIVPLLFATLVVGIAFTTATT